MSNGRCRRQSLGGAENFARLTSNGNLSKRTANSPSRTLRSNSASALLKNAKNSSRSFDGGNKSQGDNLDPKAASTANATLNGSGKIENGSVREGEDQNPAEKTKTDSDDLVSGALYDMIQKEVIALRKACLEKDQSLKDKDDAIEVVTCYHIFLLQVCNISSVSCYLWSVRTI